MKASQITSRNRKNGTVIRSLAAAAVLTFFAAGPADASCEKPLRTMPVIDHSQTQLAQNLNAYDIERLPMISTRGVLLNGYPNGRAPIRGYGRDGQTTLLGEITPMYGNTTIPIRDGAGPIWPRDKDFRRRLIEEELRRRGIIMDNQPSRPATQTGNNTGSTTTKPKPKPKPKPKKPKVTKLPNGDTITQYPDGRREIKMKNGDTVTTYPNGRRVIKRSNGSTTETHPSGYRKTTNKNGDGTARFPDGTRIDFKSSGEATLTTPDGKKFHRMPGKGFKPVD